MKHTSFKKTHRFCQCLVLLFPKGCSFPAATSKWNCFGNFFFQHQWKVFPAPKRVLGSVKKVVQLSGENFVFRYQVGWLDNPQSWGLQLKTFFGNSLSYLGKGYDCKAMLRFRVERISNLKTYIEKISLILLVRAKHTVSKRHCQNEKKN